MKKTSKLSLRTESIRVLTVSQLRQIGGGISSPRDCNYSQYCGPTNLVYGCESNGCDGSAGCTLTGTF
jgi:natural product precursor